MRVKNRAYQILKQLVPVRNQSWAIDQVEPISNRAQAIIDILTANEIECEVDLFGPGRPTMCNVIVNFNEAELEERVIFTAHHDVVNLKSDNVLDNGASCANLIALAIELKDAQLKRRVSIVFTDCEEFGGSGARRLAIAVEAGDYGRVIGIVNSELTGKGEIWTDRLETNFIGEKLREINPNMPQHATPFNDSWVFRQAGIETVCLGIMPKSQMKILQQYHSCRYWAYCHAPDDGLHNADPKDMQRYVQHLKRFTE